MVKTIAAFVIGFGLALLLTAPRHTALAQGALYFAPKAEPVVPPLSAIMDTIKWKGGVQQLDGIACKKCEITDAVFTYAGGQFQCEQCTLSARGFVFKGAALNTLNLLVAMGAIKVPAPPDDRNPNTPNLHSARLEKPTTLDLVSLEVH